MTSGWRRWMRIFRRDPQADVDAELRFHMETRMDDLIAQGVPRDDARAQALAEFGDVDTTRAALGAIDRRMAGRHRRAEWWEVVAQDGRHTLRGLARAPGFTVMVVVTLALGIGANAAVFSLIDRLMLAAPAGVARPDQVRRLTDNFRRRPGEPISTRSVLNYPEFRSIAAAAPSGVTVVGAFSEPRPYGSSLDAATVPVEFAVGDYLTVMGLHPVIGRFFAANELTVTALTPVAVISHQLWMRDFDGSTAVLGKSLDLGRHRYTIIGVAPDGFAGLGLDHVDIWLPFNTWPSWASRKPDWYEQTGTLMIRPVARLQPTASVAALAAAGTYGLQTDGVPWDSTATLGVLPLRGAALPDFFSRQNAIAVRLGVVAALILLISIANVINLMLGRAATRKHETAVRLALGVSRRRLMARTFGESLIIALLAGVAAGVTAMWGGAILRALLIPRVQWGPTSFEPSVAWFAAGLSVVTGLLVGILPAFRGSDPDLMNSLKLDARGGGRERQATRRVLVVAQVALSVVLLTGAGLFIQSLRRVTAIDLGYDVGDVLYASPLAGDDTAAARALNEELPTLARRLSGVGGVQMTSLIDVPPMWGMSWMNTFDPDRDSLPGPAPMVLVGSPGFLATLGVRLVEGRLLTERDRAGSAPVLVVNRELAHTYWPGESALGKCLILSKRTEPCRRIVGVVDNVHMAELIEQPVPAYFIPIDQAPDGWREPSTIMIRTAPGRRSAVQPVVAKVLRDALGPAIRLNIKAMSDVVKPQYQSWEMGSALFSVAGLLALLVTAVGVYSSISYSVNQRTREIAVRRALGGRDGQIIQFVVGQGVRTVAVGVVLGLVAALAMGRLVASLLYDTASHDPTVLSVAAVVLLVVAVLACLVPARRAARVDPMQTLRAE